MVSLTREQALHIADFAHRRGFKRIVVGGGEPTIMAYFREFMEKLAESGIEVWLLTNAVRMNDEIIELLAAMPSLIVHVSMDGVGEVHDYIRGEGTFAASDQAIRRLIGANIRVAVNTVVQASNFREMIATYEWFAQYPLEWHGFGFAEGVFGQELVPNEHLEECFGQLLDIHRRSLAKNGKSALSEEMIRSYRLQYRYPALVTHPGLGCTIPRRLLAIDEAGSVLPCWHYSGWTKDDSRNLNHRSLDDIVDDPVMHEEIRRAIGPEGCGGCNTLCYFWDNDFRNKVIAPDARLRMQRNIAHAKEYLRTHHPGLYQALIKIKSLAG
jgi:radical SAM protein with 4Fe4S-binding SPASM domain